MPIKITIDQFCAQWVPGDTRINAAIPKRLEFRLHDFATEAGAYAEDCFKSSFDKGGFCGHSTWAPRTSKWGTRRFRHPILFDYGKLRDGIKGTSDSTERGDWRWPINGKGGYGATKNFARTYKYNIKTTEIAVPDHEKPRRRGSVTRTKYNYAAIHNTPPEITPFTVNQHSSRKPVQRQFIGHDRIMLDHINHVILPRQLNKVLYFYYD